MNDDAIVQIWDRAIALTELKAKNTLIIGISITSPPTPAAVIKAIRITIKKIPKISRELNLNTDSRTHKPLEQVQYGSIHLVQVELDI